MNDLCNWLKIEDSDKGIIHASINSFYPLNTSDLLKNDRKIFDIKADVNRYIVNDVESPNKNITLKCPINFNSNLKVFSLVDDGWLPPIFCVPSVLLIDRNIVSAFNKKQNGANNYDDNCWWFNLYNGTGNGSLEINVIFAAIEGELLTPPKFEEFLANIRKYNNIINKQFENVNNSYLNLIQLKSIYDFILNKSYTKNIAFLQSTIPLIFKSVPYKNKQEVLNKILLRAKEYNIDTNSHLLILIISCLYESPKSDYKFARKILKPKANYTKKMAHNCVFDLFFIDLLLVLKFFINPKYSGVSADIALSAYWTIVKPKVNFESKKFSYSIELSSTLFEDASDEDLKYIVKKLNKPITLIG